MFNTFALALFAGAATALESYPQYQQYQSYQPAHQHQQHAPWAAPTQQHAPWAAPTQQHAPAHNPWAQQQSYNPWSQQHQAPAPAPVKPDGWYSVELEFSPPKIQYVPAHLHETTFGICEVEIMEGMTCTIDIGQVPHHPASVRGVCDLGSEAANMTFRAEVQKFGKLGGSCADAEAGEEFNPLNEVYNGVPNEFQDPSRGRFDTWTLDVDGKQEWMQESLMLNLGGKDSIIGKSITLYMVAEAPAADMMAGCCVIGQGMAPMAPEAPAAPEPAPKPAAGGWTHPGQYSGYQGHQGGHYGHYPQHPQRPQYSGYARGGW